MRASQGLSVGRLELAFCVSDAVFSLNDGVVVEDMIFEDNRLAAFGLTRFAGVV
jgi:hypothetical protein